MKKLFVIVLLFSSIISGFADDPLFQTLRLDKVSMHDGDNQRYEIWIDDKLNPIYEYSPRYYYYKKNEDLVFPTGIGFSFLKKQVFSLLLQYAISVSRDSDVYLSKDTTLGYNGNGWYNRWVKGDFTLAVKTYRGILGVWDHLATYNYYFTQDNTGPMVVLTNPSAVSGWLNSNSVSLDYQFTDSQAGMPGDNDGWYVTGSAVFPEGSSSSFSSLSRPNDNTQVVRIALSFLPEGENNISFQVKDRLGSTTTVSQQIFIDTTAPVITTPGSSWIDGTGLSFLATDNSGSGVDESTWRWRGSGTDSWQEFTEDLPEGENYIDVRVADNAGNVATKQSILLRIDQTAPIVTYPNSSWSNGSDLAFTV